MRSALTLALVLAGMIAGLDATARARGEPAEIQAAIAEVDATPDAALSLVRDRVDYRPYRGFVKGPRGTWWDGTGNAEDTADLLMEVLRRKGLRGRLVHGQLDEARVTTLLESIFEPGAYPEEVQEKLPGAVSDPVHDPALREIARRHVWVEAFWKGKWVALDPFLPDIEPGAAPARTMRVQPSIAPQERRRVRFEVHAKRSGASSAMRMIRAEHPLADLVGRQIVLLSRGVHPTARGRKVPPALLKPTLIVGKRVYQAKTTYAGLPGGTALGPFSKLLEGLEGADSGSGPKPPEVEEIKVTITLLGGGKPERRQHRYLLLTGDEGLDRTEELTFFCVTFGAPPEATVRAWASGAAELSGATEKLELPAAGKLSKEQGEGAVALLHQEIDVTGALALWLAYASHATLSVLDRTFGTLSDYDDGRVLAVSVDPRRGAFSTDLVFDSVRSWPRPGAKASSPDALRSARGILEAELEGAVLALASKREGPAAPKVLTVAGVFRAARSAGIGTLCLTPDLNRDRFEKLPMSAVARRIVSERLEAGRIILLPEKPVLLMGREILAWYEIDPETGEWIGVHQDGRHQAVSIYEELREEIALAADFVGAYMSAFNGTLCSYARTVLELIDTSNLSFAQIKAQAAAGAANPSVLDAISLAANDLVTLISAGDPATAQEALILSRIAILSGSMAGIVFVSRHG